MLHKRLEKRGKNVKAAGPDNSQAMPTFFHPVTNHESFSHSVLYTGAHEYRKATAGLLHGRTHTDPTKKPHQHQNQNLAWHLGRGANLRTPIANKNV